MGFPPNLTVPVYKVSPATGRLEGAWPYGDKPGIFVNSRQQQQSSSSIFISTALADDQPFMITAPNGVDFGANTGAVTDFYGGLSFGAKTFGATFNSFMSNRWAQYAGDGLQKSWKVSATYNPPSRGRSMLWDSADPTNAQAGNQGQCSYVFKPGVPRLTRMFIRRRCYMDIPGGATAQLKNVRLISITEGDPNNGVFPGGGNPDPVNDGWVPNAYFTKSPNLQGLIANNTGVINPPTWNTTGTLYTDVGFTSADAPATHSPIVGGTICCPMGQWFDQELEWEDSSAPGVKDGFWAWRNYLMDGTVQMNSEWHNIQMYVPSEVNFFKYLNFQTGFFNGSAPNEWANGKFSQYDVFVSANSRARVMLGDTPTLGAQTQLETQPYTVWTGNGIAGDRLNQGKFVNLTNKYFYIWRADGSLVSTTGYLAK